MAASGLLWQAASARRRSGSGTSGPSTALTAVRLAVSSPEKGGAAAMDGDMAGRGGGEGVHIVGFWRVEFEIWAGLGGNCFFFLGTGSSRAESESEPIRVERFRALD